MRTGAFGPRSSPALECRETNISWVFLTKDDVWKVKKPVDLGFLDFRTLDARRQACDAEVVLNARLAPDVYLGVVAVRRGHDGAHRIGAEGDVVDWAVHMRRLPDERRADVLLARGQLDGRTVDRVAARIARFHATVAGGGEHAHYGLPAAILNNVLENFAQTRDVVERYLPRSTALEIERGQTEFLRQRAAVFERRAASGRVRDGHGDLRLEHVYVGEGDELTILDCIEFNERFRFADVASDLAFLSMDLAWHGRVDLAERLVARYARESGDYDLYAVVDFYEGYRAYVRAKVSAMVASDPSVPDAARSAAERDARRFFLLSLSAERRSVLTPSLVAVGGIIACGKSTVADCLGEDLGAPVIDADRTRKQMLGLRATEHATDATWSGAYEPSFTREVYAEVLRRAAVVLDAGRPVVIDASFRSSAMRGAARELARTRGVPFQLIECRATAEACRARLQRRAEAESVSDGRLAIFDEFAASFEPMTEVPAAQHLVLDTERPLEETLAAVRAAVSTWPRGLVG